MPVDEAQAERRVPQRRRPPVADVALEGLSRRIARVCDDLLDFLVLAFAAWTVIYHVCLLLDLGTAWATLAQAVALVPCGWLAVRRSEAEPGAPRRRDLPAWLRPRVSVLRAGHVLAAGAAAVLFAFTSTPWPVVAVLWLLAAGAAVLLTSPRPTGGTVDERADRAARADARDPSRAAWPGTLVALTWAVALGTLSLFLVRPDGDDTFYVRLSSWVAAHGDFPVRDTLFSDEVFPAIIFPPLASFEALIGTIARGTDVAVPNLVYLVVPPIASALSVLAFWRLLRTWGVRLVGIALSAALLFLLMDAAGHQTFGNLFIGRIWQGKIVFLAVFVPVLLALLVGYAERPTRRQLVLLGAAGAAGVGLTSTAVFLVPIVAVGCLLPLAIRAGRQAVVGLAATLAYPLAAAAATVVVGSRNAADYNADDIVPDRLVHFVLGDGVFALLALTAVLVGPVFIRHVLADRMTAATVLLVGFLFTPPVPLLVFHLTGLARTQWRLLWAVPAAALVGVVATTVLTRVRPRAVGALAAALLCAVLVAWGTPVWSSGATKVASEPSWKRPAGSITRARLVLAQSRPGDIILAPQWLSQTILVMSGRVTTVAPRPFYAGALIGVRGAYARERLLLLWFAEQGLGQIRRAPAWTKRILSLNVRAAQVRRALRLVGVDIACVDTKVTEAERLLRAAGYSPSLSTERVNCFQAGDRGRS